MTDQNCLTKTNEFSNNEFINPEAFTRIPCISFSLVFSDTSKLHESVLAITGELMISMFNGLERYHYGYQQIRSFFDLLYFDSFTEKEKLIGLTFHVPKNRRKMVEIVRNHVTAMFPVHKQLIEEKELEDFPQIPSVVDFIKKGGDDEAVFFHESVWMLTGPDDKWQVKYW
jgi:hypothetical protein